MSKTRRLAATFLFVLLVHPGVVAPDVAHAKPGDAYSSSGPDDPTPISTFTQVASRKLHPGTYSISVSGILRNRSTTDPATVRCTLNMPFDVQAAVNPSEVSLPVAPAADQPAGGTFSITGILRVPQRAIGPARIAVDCSVVAGSGDVVARYTTMVAVEVDRVFNKGDLS